MECELCGEDTRYYLLCEKCQKKYLQDHPEITAEQLYEREVEAMYRKKGY